MPNVLKVAEFFLNYLLANGGQTTTGSLEKWTEPMGPKVCLHPKKAKLESLLGAAQGRAWGKEAPPAKGVSSAPATHRGISPLSCPPPALGSNEILVPKSQSAHSSTAALG